MFADFEVARRVWRRVRECWPLALSACLMPNHLHLQLSVPHRKFAREQMGHLMSGVSRCLGRARVFHPADVSSIADLRHAYRVSRYIHLNPCTDGLVEDPLAWPFSTYRGVLGAEVDPWVEAARLANALERESDGFAARYHDYVTCGPDRCAPSVFPVVAPPSEFPSHSLDAIVRAATVSGVWVRPNQRSRIAVKLARRQGWRETGHIARQLGLSTSQVRRLSQPDASDEWLNAPAMCLGDARLTRL